jgi:hypothetical protein
MRTARRIRNRPVIVGDRGPPGPFALSEPPSVLSAREPSVTNLFCQLRQNTALSRQRSTFHVGE